MSTAIIGSGVSTITWRRASNDSVTSTVKSTAVPWNARRSVKTMPTRVVVV